MSPNRRNYQDGVDDGNSSWYDRDRFQKDNDYYDGVRDGWRDKERRAEQARDDAMQKMLDRADQRYESSYTSSGNSSSDTTSDYGIRPGLVPLGAALGILGCMMLNGMPSVGIGMLVLAGIFLLVGFTG